MYGNLVFFCLSNHRWKKGISSVIRQKGESQNGCFKKAKHAKIFEKQTFFVCFSKILACFSFLKHSFRDSPFCFITDDLSIKKVVRYLRNQSKYKSLGTRSISCQFVACCMPYVHLNSLNYSPFSSL